MNINLNSTIITDSIRVEKLKTVLEGEITFNKDARICKRSMPTNQSPNAIITSTIAILQNVAGCRSKVRIPYNDVLDWLGSEMI